MIAFCAPGEPVPEDFPLWLERRALFAGESLVWDTDHGEEAAFIVTGDAGCRALIVEAGVDATLTARTDCVVAVMGRRDARTTGGSRVHCIGDVGTWAKVEPGGDTRYYADSECPTCDITLFTTARADEYVSEPHEHSADELIHVLDGELVVGRRRLGPGSTIAISAGTRYGFRSPHFAFLNYRPHAATITRNGVEQLEGPRAHGFDRVG